MVAGGFAVAGNRIQEIEDKIAQLRGSSGIQSEFHWSDYRGGKRRQGYFALVDYGFELVEQHKAALHLIVSPFKGYNHKAKKGENRDTSVNRMYYQVCLHRLAGFYGKRRAIHVRLDAGNDCADICAMREQLCAAAYKTHHTRPNCIRSIEPVNSEKSGIVQMVDVIIGGIAAKKNGIVHTSPKGELTDYILARSGRQSWDTETPREARFLTVWHFKGKKGPSPPYLRRARLVWPAYSDGEGPKGTARYAICHVASPDHRPGTRASADLYSRIPRFRIEDATEVRIRVPREICGRFSGSGDLPRRFPSACNLGTCRR